MSPGFVSGAEPYSTQSVSQMHNRAKYIHGATYFRERLGGRSEEKMSRIFYPLSVLFGNILFMVFYGFLTFQFHSN